MLLSSFAFVLVSGVAAYSGRMSWYNAGLGACGNYNSDSEYVVAMNQAQYPGSCGRCVEMRYDGKTTRATVVDLCPSCEYGMLDVTPTVFSSFKSLDEGILYNVEWDFCGESSAPPPPPPPPPPPAFPEPTTQQQQWQPEPTTTQVVLQQQWQPEPTTTQQQWQPEPTTQVVQQQQWQPEPTTTQQQWQPEPTTTQQQQQQWQPEPTTEVLRVEPTTTSTASETTITWTITVPKNPNEELQLDAFSVERLYELLKRSTGNLTVQFNSSQYQVEVPPLPLRSACYLYDRAVQKNVTVDSILEELKLKEERQL